MMPPGPIALRAAADAEANVGVHEEGGENRGRWIAIYLQEAGLPAGEPWCAAFVIYRLRRAAERVGRPLPADFPQSGECAAYKNWARKNGVWMARSSRPQRGDLCLFYFPARRRVAHIGIVVKPLLSRAFWTVEGNTGREGGGVGVIRDGDGVYRKLRHPENLGRFGGYVRLGF